MKTAPIFITSLARKKAELEAEAEHHEKRAAKARNAIATIQATLALFDEGKWVRSERRSYRENPGPFKWRELPRLVVQVIQQAGKPLTTPEITKAILEPRGVVLDSPKERKAMSRRICGAINDKRRQGVLRAAGTVGNLTLWEIDPDGDNKRAEAHTARNAARSDARAKRSREIAAGLHGK